MSSFALDSLSDGGTNITPSPSGAIVTEESVCVQVRTPVIVSSADLGTLEAAGFSAFAVSVQAVARSFPAVAAEVLSSMPTCIAGEGDAGGPPGPVGTAGGDASGAIFPLLIVIPVIVNCRGGRSTPGFACPLIARTPITIIPAYAANPTAKTLLDIRCLLMV
jgi:hypothetical protein